jgi:hypothetical protein
LSFPYVLSRACLGKIMHFIYKWLKKCRFLTSRSIRRLRRVSPTTAFPREKTQMSFFELSVCVCLELLLANQKNGRFSCIFPRDTVNEKRKEGKRNFSRCCSFEKREGFVRSRESEEVNEKGVTERLLAVSSLFRSVCLFARTLTALR